MITIKFITYILCWFPIIILFKVNGNLKNKEKYENLKKSLLSIKDSCGNVCDQIHFDHNNNTEYFNRIEKKIDCDALFRNSDIDASSEFQYPPQKIPKWLLSEYNYGGRVPISYYYRDDSR